MVISPNIVTGEQIPHTRLTRLNPRKTIRPFCPLPFAMVTAPVFVSTSPIFKAAVSAQRAPVSSMNSSSALSRSCSHASSSSVDFLLRECRKHILGHLRPFQPLRRIIGDHPFVDEKAAKDFCRCRVMMYRLRREAFALQLCDVGVQQIERDARRRGYVACIQPGRAAPRRICDTRSVSPACSWRISQSR